MNKNSLSIKKVLKAVKPLLLCLVLMSINSAAAVSDNDGSAFITKTEFDVLKSSFQEQINTYNQNIDSKIDSAIASYLAGVSLSAEMNLKTCTANIEYPLYYYMKDLNLDLSTWNTNGATPYWAPNWHIYLYGMRSVATFCCEKDATQLTKVNWFYNGSWDASKNKYKIDNILDNYNATISVNGRFYQYTHDDWSGEPYVTFGFVFDQNNIHARATVRTNLTKRNYIKTSGTELVTFKQDSILNHNLIVEVIWDWGGSLPPTLSSSDTSNNEAYLDSFKADKLGYFEANNPKKLTVFPTVKYDGKRINKIFNANDTDRTDATGKMIEVPVAYNYDVYLTNKNNFKSDILNRTYTKAEYYNGKHSTQWGFGTLLTPGWTLEPQFSTLTSASGAMHSKQNRSLMEPQDMYYEVTTPYTNQIVDQVLSDGFLLTEVDDELKSMEINFDVTLEDMTNDKYICFSTSPISEINYNNVLGNDYIDIADNASMTGKTKKLKLVNGVNKICFGELSANDKIYYKILWDKDDTSYVKINDAPTIKGVTK